MRIPIANPAKLLMLLVAVAAPQAVNAETIELDSRQTALCTMIEDRLIRLQTLGSSIEEDAFEAASNSLKEHWENVCGKSDYDLAHVAQMERDIHELDENLGYLEVFVSKNGGGGPKILVPFETRHKACAPGCGYVSWGIWGDKAHQRRKSCHNSGDAIDIHALRCGNKLDKAGSSARFNTYLACMKKGKFKIIFGNKDHKNHAHIELNPCRKISGSLQKKVGNGVSTVNKPAPRRK